MQKEKYRAGVIGCGFIANAKHFPALMKLKDRIEITAVCDLIPERAKKAAEQYGAENCLIYEDYRQLLAQETIDVVYVLTPNRLHFELTVAALEAGKHVMCEKPMACTEAEAVAMCKAAKQSGKLLTIGYQYRCRHDSLMLKKVIQNGDLGEIYYAQAHAIRRRGIPNWGVFLNKDEQGGGALIDIGTHALDMTLWLMDCYEPKMVLGQTFHKLGAGETAGNRFGPWDTTAFKEVEDSAFATILMKNGAWISLESSWALNILDNREQKITLCGTEGGADMDDGIRLNGVKYGELYTTKPLIVTPKFEAEKEPADVEAENWLAALDGTEELRVKPEQALTVTKILEAVYRSAEIGAPVWFD